MTDIKRCELSLRCVLICSLFDMESARNRHEHPIVGIIRQVNPRSRDRIRQTFGSESDRRFLSQGNSRHQCDGSDYIAFADWRHYPFQESRQPCKLLRLELLCITFSSLSFHVSLRVRWLIRDLMSATCAKKATLATVLLLTIRRYNSSRNSRSSRMVGKCPIEIQISVQ